MREIKFRAWDSHNKKIWHPETIGKGYAAKGDNLMQYTGLKDKNGSEIYEGDIVKNMHGVAPVKFEGGAFCVQWDSSALNKVMYYWDDNDFEGEVIGNIYENPELLEGEL